MIILALQPRRAMSTAIELFYGELRPFVEIERKGDREWIVPPPGIVLSGEIIPRQRRRKYRDEVRGNIVNGFINGTREGVRHDISQQIFEATFMPAAAE